MLRLCVGVGGDGALDGLGDEPVGVPPPRSVLRRRGVLLAQLGAQLTEGHHAIRQEVRQMQEAMLEMTHTLEALSGGACASAVSRASVGSR